jgi:hypothetical protein
MMTSTLIADLRTKTVGSAANIAFLDIHPYSPFSVFLSTGFWPKPEQP